MAVDNVETYSLNLKDFREMSDEFPEKYLELQEIGLKRMRNAWLLKQKYQKLMKRREKKSP